MSTVVYHSFFKSLALPSGLLLGHLLGRLLGKINAKKVSDSALTCENAIRYLNFYLVDYSVQHEEGLQVNPCLVTALLRLL